ncbi:MAG: ribbon-helix-helix domain-containing protein [Planctomycetota bacterium]
MAKRRVTITIDEDLASRLDEVAEGMDGKFSKAVEHAVREFFDLEKLRGGEQGFVWIDFGNDDDGRWAFRGNEPEMMLQLGPVLMRAFFSSVETAWEEDDAED